MNIKKYEQFYKDNNIKVEFDEDGMPILNGIDCMCNIAKCPNNYSCHGGIPCELFEPNKRYEIWQKQGIDSKDIDWDKEYILIKEKTPDELKMKELEARIEVLENQILNKKQ